MELKNLLKKPNKDEPAKLSKTKTAVAEMLLDDELLKMVAGGTSTNLHAYPPRGKGDKSDIL